MINILHIINGWPSGGIAEQVYLLCKYLPKDQFKQYSIGYCHFDGAFVKKFEDVGVECIHSDEDYTNLEEIIKEKNIHIVHKQTGGGDFPRYIFLLNRMGIPVVESLHCPRASGIPHELLSKIIYTTQYTLKKNSPKHQEKMQSIMYALDLKGPLRHAPKTTAPKMNGEKLVVGRLGRIVIDKRPDVILHLAEKCHKEYGDKIQFKLAGMIPTDYEHHIKYGEDFKQQVSRLPNCEYVGYVENKYDFWQQLDVCINPVWETSFDIVFLEAMALGIPILTWNNSAAKHVVGNAGIVTEENIYDLFEGLKKLYLDKKLRDLLGSIGIRYIKEKYSLDKMIDEYIKMYKGLV